MSSIVCSHVSFAWPDDTPLFTDLSFTVDGTVGYLPQSLPFDADKTVAEVLGIATVVDALNALADGDAGDEEFTAIGDDWDLEERTRAQLDRLGLAHVDLDRRLGSLSGGEVVSVGLAGQLLKRPDVLLLDEPTTTSTWSAPDSSRLR